VRDEGGRAVADLDVTTPQWHGAAVLRYRLVEAFWDRSFPPPSRKVVLRWSWASAWGQVWHSFRILRDPANRRRGGRWAGDQGDEPWTPPWWVVWLYRLELGLVGVALAIAWVVGVPLLGLLWLLTVLDGTPGLRLFGLWARASDAVRTLDPFLTRVLGDSQRYVEHAHWAAAAREQLEAPLLELLDDDAVADITVIAFSAGCGVAYDALLAGGRLGDAWEERAAAGQPPKKLTLITTGAAVNRFFIASQRARLPFARRFAERAIDPRIAGRRAPGAAEPEETDRLRQRFFWLNVYARLDPVPGGPVLPQLLAASGLEAAQLKERQVINFDNPLEDHGGYFTNAELVLPRLVRAMTGGAYPWPRREADREVKEADLTSAERGRADWAYEGARERVPRVAGVQAVRAFVGGAWLAHVLALATSAGWRDATAEAVRAAGEWLARVFDPLGALGGLFAGEAYQVIAPGAGAALIALGPLVLGLAFERLWRERSFPELDG
jgi:hypothetical protein